jgi:hypothetical protein
MPRLAKKEKLGFGAALPQELIHKTNGKELNVR